MMGSKGLSKRTQVAAFLILILMPLTIAYGVLVLDDRKYYFISMLLMLYSMIPFFMVFEDRGPKAREVILIATLVALAVAGRSAFFMLPQFKPVVAIVMITGICLGAEAGFLVGAMTGFVSNFFFGQGPWTVWQMFCFGLIGFLTGLIYRKGIQFHKEQKWRTLGPLCVLGGLLTFFVYGGIINIGSVLMATGTLSLGSLATYYISAIGFDVIHSLATVFFLACLAKPMVEKIERVKTKYGLIQT